MSTKLAAGAVAGVAGLILASVIGTAAVGGTSASAANTTGIKAGKVPADFLPWVMKAGALCDGESPALIAAQISQESNFNAAAVGPETSSGTAKGAAQFVDASWGTWGRDDDGSGTASPYDIGDAVMAQGRYMCALVKRAKDSGYPGGAISLALAGYNAGWGRVDQYQGVPPASFAGGQTYNYVRDIIAKAAEWVDGVPAVAGTGSGADAARKAATYLGTPYVYGGGTPEGPSTGFCSGNTGYLNGVCFAASHQGFDCSSLTENAWWSTTHLPRTAADQYTATASHPVSMDALQVGDLIFWSHTGSGSDAYHVAMYYGDGKIIEAPRTGKNVQIVKLYRSGGLVGATRPA
ncbi:NlpC/P60 family protein (plasmid) [Streptomyces sp. NBC_01136]|uniref:C40 family peptidase n=1 Tax=Streptomyces sp. NBC_01136 TaxID=2903754 RepID=UPI002F9091C1|nr:NlpC/P60 family protein [Streptomyces sp. NBC_01136]